MQKPINFTKCSSGPIEKNFSLTFWPISKQTAYKFNYIISQLTLAIDARRFGYHSFSVLSTVHHGIGMLEKSVGQSGVQTNLRLNLKFFSPLLYYYLKNVTYFKCRRFFKRIFFHKSTRLQCTYVSKSFMNHDSIL